jgi:RNase H-fold protein (predicted Holliday junction resolvase)
MTWKLKAAKSRKGFCGATTAQPASMMNAQSTPKRSKKLRTTALGFPLNRDGTPVEWSVEDWKDFHESLTAFAARVCKRAGRSNSAKAENRQFSEAGIPEQQRKELN